MKFKSIPYIQNSQRYIATVLPFSVIEEHSEVLIYGKSEGGYQREPQPVHYRKIANYISENHKTFKLPTSIILGIDTEDAEKILNSDTSELDFEKLSGKFLRIVDGQHRVYGISQALKSFPDLKDLQLNVVIVISPTDQRSIELEIFKDINSKAKRINVDLATLATRDYEILEKHIDKKDISSHIAWKVAFKLKSDKNTVWSNGIKFDIHADITLGIIGISAFIDSVKGIIDYLISDTPIKIMDGKDLIKGCDEEAERIAILLRKVWDQIILNKWKFCFSKDHVYNDEGHLVTIFYDKRNYIQKPIGVKSLHKLFLETLKIENRDIDKSMNKFENMLETSNVKSQDWKSGGPFSGFNSEGGFSKIGKMIANEINVPRELNSNF